MEARAPHISDALWVPVGEHWRLCEGRVGNFGSLEVLGAFFGLPGQLPACK